MLFIAVTTYLNKDLLDAETSYHISLEVGSPNGQLRQLSLEIRGDKYHDVQMLRDRLGVDLEVALTFQK